MSNQLVEERTSFRPEEVQGSVSAIYDFVNTPSFVRILSDLYSQPVDERPAFVLGVLLDPEEMARRGVHAPPDMIIQRSVFEDGRPTLFCVTKYLSDKRRKVTITFDNPLPQAVNKN